MTHKTMKAAVLTHYQNIEWLDVPVPTVLDDDVLIQVGYAGICGSDQHIFLGEFAPRTSTPLIQGHEFGGRITAVGKDVQDLKVGERVVVDPIVPCGRCAACAIQHYPACVALKLIGVDMDGGFAEYVTAKAHACYKITDAIPDRHAAMVELFSIGFHACNRSGIRSGDSALIWGGGRVGQVIMQAARTKTDAPIFIVDISDNRLQIAAQTCANIIPINPKNQNPIDVVQEYTKGRGVDVAFEAVGHGVHLDGIPDPVIGCVRTIRGAGTVCVLGLSDEPAPLVMKELIWREAKIIASRVSHGEFRDAIEQMQQGRLDPEALISADMPASQAQEAFRILEKDPDNHLKIILDISA